MTFANPAGAWALLGLLAILAIHFLQRRSPPVVVTTLFLLEPLTPRVDQGTRLERLRSSPSLWLQLLSVLLLTWLLVGPRFLRAESVQRVIVVLDASASMRAFRPRLRSALVRRTDVLSRAAARTEWVLLDTALGQRTLFSGAERDGLLGAADTWEPLRGSHDAAPSLEIARTLAGAQGLVVFVTDHVADVPDGVELLAVGSPTENVGFVGLDVEGNLGEGSFRALVKNHGRQAATRSFHAEAGSVKGPSSSIRLEPGALHVLSGTFPSGRESFELVLEPDAFSLDDRLALVRPRPKPLRVHVTAAAEAVDVVGRFVSTLDEVVRVGAGADQDLTILASTYGALPNARSAIVLGAAADGRAAYLRGPIVAERHPLVEDLNWQGLLVRPGRQAPGRDPGDRVLLWQGTRPLVRLRGPDGTPHLVVDFPLADSNAGRLPALPLLLHRFGESVRAATVGHEQANVETGQRLSVASDAAGSPLTIDAGGELGATDAAVASEPLLRAPDRPGFFRVVQGTSPRLTAAARFADAREADLRGAAARELPSPHAHMTLVRNSRVDPLTPVWTLLLGGLLVADWRWQARAARSLRG